MKKLILTVFLLSTQSGNATGLNFVLQNTFLVDAKTYSCKARHDQSTTPDVDLSYFRLNSRELVWDQPGSFLIQSIEVKFKSPIIVGGYFQSVISGADLLYLKDSWLTAGKAEVQQGDLVYLDCNPLFGGLKHQAKGWFEEEVELTIQGVATEPNGNKLQQNYSFSFTLMGGAQ